MSLNWSPIRKRLYGHVSNILLQISWAICTLKEAVTVVSYKLGTNKHWGSLQQVGQPRKKIMLYHWLLMCAISRYSLTSIIRTSIIRTLEYPNSQAKEILGSKYNMGPRGQIRTSAYNIMYMHVRTTALLIGSSLYYTLHAAANVWHFDRSSRASTMATGTRQRKQIVLSIKDKVKIIKLLDESVSYSVIMEKYGTRKSTVSDINYAHFPIITPILHVQTHKANTHGGRDSWSPIIRAYECKNDRKLLSAHVKNLLTARAVRTATAES